ncbi:MAG: family 10 glycosylhydrolase [Synechococcales cyanobacterium]
MQKIGMLVPSFVTRLPKSVRQWVALTVSALVVGLSVMGWVHPSHSQTPRYTLDSYCRQSASEVTRKAQLRQLASQSDRDWAAYTQILGEHRDMLRRCRQARWPKIQAIWVRLYTCDQQPGVLDEVFDRVVNLGYNRVFLEVFRDSGTILPAAASSTWATTTEQDLFRLGLNAAKQRGLSAYAWMFSLNFGSSYQRPDRQEVLARNGRGQTSIMDEPTDLSNLAITDIITTSEVFVDPFSPQARQDYQQLVQQVLLRQPDGVLFDYIRYPRGAGRSTLAQNVGDLWIHGTASRQRFAQLGTNPPGQALLSRYLQQGRLTAGDIQAIDAQFGGVQPQWRPPGQGTTPPPPTPTPDLSTFVVSAVQGELTRDPVPTASPTPRPAIPPAATRASQWQAQLWPLAVNFARFAVIDFLRNASQPVQARGLPTGAVFFPDGNRAIQSGFDARLQPWDQFTSQNEWHPMAYALCEDASCVVREVDRVLKAAPAGVFVCPAIAGLWGTPLRQRPPLEVQMSQLQQQFPQLPCVSHFSLSWIDSTFSQQRRSCRVSS